MSGRRLRRVLSRANVDRRAAVRNGCPAGIFAVVATLLGTAAAAAPDRARAFELALQDNAVVLAESGMRHRAFFRHARRWGVRTIQIDATYHDWRTRGPAYFDHGVDASRRAGFRVRLRLMPSPTWQPQGWLSASRYRPLRMRRWARQVAAHFGRRVTRYTIGNEPNHPKFQAAQDPCAYRSLYEWGRRGIREGHPRRRRGRVRIYAGETNAWPTVHRWWRQLTRCPAVFHRRLRMAALMHHPYQSPKISPAQRLNEASWGISSIERCVRFARRHFRAPCYASEYGIPALHPRQRPLLRAAIRRARRAKLGGFVIYQLVRSSTRWNTGLVPPVFGPP